MNSSSIEKKSPFAELPDGGGRLFVVGDIHGCADELYTLLEMLSGTITPIDRIVFLGDYIDRGPASAQVVELLLQFRSHHQQTRFLMGNHERMLLEFIDGPRNISHRFLSFGGIETFESYKIPPVGYFESKNAGIPDRHLTFLRELELGIQSGKYLLAHAGINPQLALDDHTETELLWVREGFHIHPYPYTVVYGHVAYEDIQFDLPYRIGIDTGLVFGNKLSCVELKEGTAHQVKRGSSHVRHRGL